MLKKLRLRFVGINMAIVLVILCTIFGVLLHTTHANLERESVDMITAVAADPCSSTGRTRPPVFPTLRCAYRPMAACA